MLIRFRVRNFLSFYNEVELSMIPGLVRKHPEHIVKGEDSGGIDILRSAILYGPNASGKSNLIKAMEFARSFIMEGTRAKETIPHKPFKLLQNAKKEPSRFEFELQQDEQAYAYGFEIDGHRVHEEWLYELKKTTETMLFERVTTSENETSVKFGNIKLKNKKEQEFLEFVAMGTRPNQLFLTESLQRDVKYFEKVFDWFREKLVVILPFSHYTHLGRFGSDTEFSQRMVQYLEQLGTGISGFELKDVDIESEFPKELVDTILESAPTGADNGMIVFGGPEEKRYIVEISEGGQLRSKKLMLRHKMADCEDETVFEMHEESDGTRRMMDLLPTLAILAEPARVFVIDELDRSLHPELSYRLVELFLGMGNSRSQMIATTHEEHLLNFDLLRRDEIWFIEKDRQGASQLYSLEEFAPRYDKDIEKGYLKGRFGAIPVFRNVATAEQVG